jgi:hypothetical protein
VIAVITGWPRALRKWKGMLSLPGAEFEEQPLRILAISSSVVSWDTSKLGLLA